MNNFTCNRCVQRGVQIYCWSQESLCPVGYANWVCKLGMQTVKVVHRCRDQSHADCLVGTSLLTGLRYLEDCKDGLLNRFVSKVLGSWKVGWLVGRLLMWLVGRLVAWLVGRSVGW